MNNSTQHCTANLPEIKCLTSSLSFTVEDNIPCLFSMFSYRKHSLVFSVHTSPYSVISVTVFVTRTCETIDCSYSVPVYSSDRMLYVIVVLNHHMLVSFRSVNSHDQIIRIQLAETCSRFPAGGSRVWSIWWGNVTAYTSLVSFDLNA